MRSHRVWLAGMLLLLFTSACGPLIAMRDQRATSAAATVRAAVHVTPVPGRPTRTPYVTRTSTPAATDTAPAPTDTAPAAVATPEAGRGAETILLLEPGSGSSIVSPVHVAGEADPTFEQSLVVQLTDAEGAVVATVPVQIAAEAGQRGPFSVDVSFSVSADQPGRVSVFSASARDGGLIHLASAEVMLLASGAASLTTGQSHPESIALSEPQFLATVSGGTAHLTGFSDYVFENQLGVVICGEGGAGAPDLICGTKDNLLGTGTAYVNSPDMGQPGPFSADVNYTVAAPMRGRIVVFDTSPRDGGLTHLTSQELTLAP